MRTIPDPRGRELDAFLGALDPKTEFATRLALRGLSPHCRGDRAFNARTEVLQAKLCGSSQKLAGYLTRAGAITEKILRELKG